MKMIIAAFAAALISTGASAATVIYSEDFTGQNGKGATGNNADVSSSADPIIDLSGVDWTIDLADAALFDTGDDFLVSQSKFRVVDTNAGCSNTVCSGTNPDYDDIALPMWLSPLIDVSGYSSLNLMLDYFFSGSPQYEASGGIDNQDTFDISRLLDGSTTETTSLITTTGTQMSGMIDVSLIASSTVQIKITANSYAANEVLSFDNILLTGAVAAVPLPAGSILLLTGLGALALRRRRH